MTNPLVPPYKPLTPKENLFITELLKDGNQAAAFRRAGFKSKSPNAHAARMAAKGSVRAEIERRRSAATATLERTAIATLGEVKEILSAQLRGIAVEAEIARIEALMAEASSADDTPDTIARRKIGYLFDIIHARISAGAEIGRAAERLARLKGALDPARKPLPDRKQALDALMMTLVKSTDGHTLAAQMRAVGFTDI